MSDIRRSWRRGSPWAGALGLGWGLLLASALALASVATLVIAPRDAIADEGSAAAPLGVAARIHAEQYRTAPWLVVAAIGAGVEPHDRGGSDQPTAFGVAGQLLWCGMIGPALGLYATEGSPVLPADPTAPGFGDRISIVAGAALRPLAFIAWRRGDDYLARLAAGVGLELGAALEITRTSLENAFAPGVHALVSAEVPIWGGASQPGVTLRLGGRLLVTPEQQLAPDRDGKPQVVQPGTAVQVLASLVFYL